MNAVVARCVALEKCGAPLGKWKPYPAYRDSGVEWLWHIPANWQVSRIKHLAGPGYKTFVDGDWIESPYIESQGIRLIQTGNIGVGEYREQGYRYISEETFSKLHCTEVMPGDVLICRLADPVGRACLAPDLGGRMITSVDVCILRPDRSHDSRFIVYFLSSSAYLSWMQALSRGSTRDRISRSMLGNIELPLPSLPEQCGIAAFLDRETATIDRLVAKQERLIALLQEKRAALISHTVTKGLNPTTPMKDSGVPWLGEIPRHWEVVMLKRLASIRYGLGQPPTESETGTPLIRATNVKHGRIAESGMMYVDPTHVPESRDAQLRAEEIIVVRSGAYTGDSTIVPEEYAGAIAGYDMVVTTRNGFSPYIAWQLLGPEIYELQFSFHKLRAAQPHLNAEELGSTLVVFPPEPEQRAIAAYLDRETAKLDALTTGAQEMIERLQEYRTALISAAVTGKIDVREETQCTSEVRRS